MSIARTKLITLLTELFQLDQPDLDFGIYRLLRVRAAEIKTFLDRDLLRIAAEAVGGFNREQTVRCLAEITTKVKATLGDAALDAQGTLTETYRASPIGQEYQAAQATALQAQDAEAAEAEIYDHLYRFFSRYYDDGDFISCRYYARETDTTAAPYAIPYHGEEVKLVWANMDQYYIKTAEHFRSYAVDLRASPEVMAIQHTLDLPVDRPLRLRLEIVDATEGAHNNVKESDKRFFIIHHEQPIRVNEAGELIVQVEYRTDPDMPAKTQERPWRDQRADEIVRVALATLDANDPVQRAYAACLRAPAPPDKHPQRPLLAKIVTQYTARNTRDYFIHKDLGGFLTRELDFYLKNEVVRLDEMVDSSPTAVSRYLGKVQVIRKIGRAVIEFMGQLEDFQKKLWLKKKLVVESEYCVPVKMIPRDCYSALISNERQISEWVKLFGIDKIEADTTGNPGYTTPLQESFFEFNATLPVDTRYFDRKFKESLLESISDLDKSVSGILINADNYASLRLIAGRYAKTIKATYIDPPYNIGDDGFLYKDSYQHSSWISMMNSRIEVAKGVFRSDYSLLCSIDDNESSHLKMLLNAHLSPENMIADIAYERSGSSGLGQGGKIVNTKESILVYCGDKSSLNDVLYQRPIDYEVMKRYCKILSNAGSREKVDSFVAPSTGENVQIYKHKDYQIGTISLRDYDNRIQEINAEYAANFQNIFRLTSVQKENEFQNRILNICKEGLYSADYLVSRGRFAGQRVTLYYVNGQILVWLHDSATLDGRTVVKGNKITDHWSHGEIPKADLANEGGVTLSRGKKPEQLIRRLIEWATNADDWVLDYFAGSGTTAAVAHKTNRRYIAIDNELYFRDKSLRRIKNVIFGEKSGVSKHVDWKGGGICRYLTIESYEDAINNLELIRSSARQTTLETNPDIQRDYLLRYLLDAETRGQGPTLNLQLFADPRRYTLRVKVPGSEASQEQPVDLLETFNWLIGLRVKHIAASATYTATCAREPDPDLPDANDTRLRATLRENATGTWWFRTVEGTDPEGQRVLVIWRTYQASDMETSNAVLEAWFRKHRLNPIDTEHDLIYVNGSNALPNLRRDADGERWKVNLIEEHFHRLMWDVSDV